MARVRRLNSIDDEADFLNCTGALTEIVTCDTQTPCSGLYTISVLNDSTSCKPDTAFSENRRLCTAEEVVRAGAALRIQRCVSACVRGFPRFGRWPRGAAPKCSGFLFLTAVTLLYLL